MMTAVVRMPLFLGLKERFQIREGFVGGGFRGRNRDAETRAIASNVFDVPLVFVVVAIQAQVLPVAAIRRVVVVIVILVMDG